MWIIGGGVADSATPQLTLFTDGTPDATAHANSIHLGATEDGVTFVSKASFDDINVDQLDSPVARFYKGQEAGLSATLKTLDFSVIQNCAPYMTYATAAGYKQLTGGGLVTIAEPCVALICPKRANVAKYFVFILFKAIGSLGFEGTFSRGKDAMYKAEFKGIVDGTRTNGRQLFCMYETI